MDFNNGIFLSVLSNLISELDESKKILNEVKESGHIYNSKKLIELYERLFSSDLLKPHIEFKISYVDKSTHSLSVRVLNELNANRHITLNLISKESIFFDQLYDNRLSDLLKFYKHLFSAIENLYIYQNNSKLNKFDTLIEEIKKDISLFIRDSIAADKNQGNLLAELKQKERHEFIIKKEGNQYKSNWQLFLNVILDNGIEFLYHFTDISNISSIKKNNGLYSWAFCLRNNIIIPRPGGDELSRNLDKGKGTENYVRLSFCKDHPMKFIAKRDGRINETIELICKPELIYHIGTKFCNMNAAKNIAVISDDIEYFRSINFNVFKKNYQSLDCQEKSLFQSEILVFEHVPSNLIMNFSEL